MTQQDKDLLLRDLSARLPYGVKVQVEYDAEEFGKTIEIDEITMIDKYGKEILLYHAGEYFSIEELKPYLRPMSSMTVEEREEYQKFLFPCPDYDGRVVVGVYHRDLYKVYDWLNAHHFDYRGLIEKGLAIEVIPENNPYKQHE